MLFPVPFLLHVTLLAGFGLLTVASSLLKNPPFPASHLVGRPNSYQDKILEKMAFKSASE